MRFADRQQAGKMLANKLKGYKHRDIVVLALPRGGVVIGAEVAKRLEAPLGLVLVRKIGHPLSPEYAVGALAEDDKAIYNQHEIEAIDEEWLKEAETAARTLIEQRRELYYADDLIMPELAGKTVILVDDGVATGLTIEAASHWLRRQNIKELIIAVPVAPSDSVINLEQLADRTIVLIDPDKFYGAVGSHYDEFGQVGDEEVSDLLQAAQSQIRSQISRS